MSTWQFDTSINPDLTLNVPPEVAAELGKDALVHVVVIRSDSDDDASWRRLATDQFLAGYSQGDDIYDQLPSG